MVKAVAFIQPFEKIQKIYIYENGNKLDIKETTVDNLNNVIFSLVEKYKMNVLEMAGPKQFNKGLAKKIKDEELSKYSTNNLQIVYL